MNPGGVLIVGLDGGTLEVLRPLAEHGVMPAFRSLLERGRAGTLHSTVPWYTVPGWASLMMGVSPATHGLLYWVTADPSDYFEKRRTGRRFITSGDFPLPTFWDVAGAAGKRVAVVNMPLTYPAWPVNGTMVTGLLTPVGATTSVTHPEGLLERFPGYRIDLSVSKEAHPPDEPPIGRIELRGYLEELVEITEGRRRLSTTLLAEDVDLGVVVFVGPDRISHKAWDEQAALARQGSAGSETQILIEAYYRSLDRAIGELVETAGPEATVMVVADHGFGPPAQRTFEVNGWLREAGYLRLRWDRVNRVTSSNRVLRRAARDVARWRRGRRGGPLVPPEVDWTRTSVYGFIYPHTRTFALTLNRKGVKRLGWVEDDAAEALLARLREELLSLTDERGRRVIRRIMPPDVLPPRPGFPDLVAEVEEPFSPRSGLRRARLFDGQRTTSGLHEREGVFVVAGPRVRGSGEASAHIVDVAPSALGLLGLEPPAHVEGEVLSDVLDLPERTAPPPDIPGPSGREASISERERAEIEAHLSALGYTD